VVVETTNFTHKSRYPNTTQDMRLTERFTHVDPETTIYEFTVNDPATFARSWTASLPMMKTKGPFFEFAGHEGNYGMEGMLSGARAHRAQERVAH
jgi:hypothetical protein